MQHNLPTGFPDSRYLPFVRQRSKTDSADLELAIDGFGPAAKLTARILSDTKFRLLFRLVFQRFS
jgi:hypothetical protein